MQQVKIKRLHDHALMPVYSTAGAAAVDLSQAWAESDNGKTTIHTGLAMEIPPGMVGLILPRSGLGAKFGFRLLNTAGVIDSDYRGEVMIKVSASVHRSAGINDGDRVAQMLFLPVFTVNLIESNELGDTSRGSGGFGHTGV
jgi:dUTP pyrophosphatase